jgi:hypothetical protein
MDYRYITLFSINGFENIIDISNDLNAKIEDILNDSTETLEKRCNTIIMKTILSAKEKSHLYPEVWIFWSEFSEDIIYKFSKEEPQMLANLIREKGECLFKIEKPSTIIL